VRWLAGGNLNNDIVRGLLRRKPDFDIVRVQDAGLSGVDDRRCWPGQRFRIAY
jgi:hypothetical protein